MEMSDYLRQQKELTSGSGKLEGETINVFKLKVNKISGARLRTCNIIICPSVDVENTVFNSCTLTVCDLSQFRGCTFLKCSYNLQRSDSVLFEKCRFIRSNLGANSSVIKNVPFKPVFKNVTMDIATKRYFLSRPVAQLPNSLEWKGDVVNTVRG